jgi:hypothetical protein
MVRSAGSAVAAQHGRPRPMTLIPIRSIGASAMLVRTSTPNTDQATINGRRAYLSSARWGGPICRCE